MQVYPEAFFATSPMETLLGIGALSTSLRVVIDLEDGALVEFSSYSVVLSVGGREGTSLAVASEGTRPVLGSKFLEDLGLRINPKSVLLEPSRDPHFVRECEE